MNARIDSTGTPLQQCAYCGGPPHLYVGQCPAVRALEFYETGHIKRVEKFGRSGNDGRAFCPRCQEIVDTVDDGATCGRCKLVLP